MKGQQVLSAKPNASEHDLDISHLQTGTYSIKVTIKIVTKTVRATKP